MKQSVSNFGANVGHLKATAEKLQLGTEHSFQDFLTIKDFDDCIELIRFCDAKREGLQRELNQNFRDADVINGVTGVFAEGLSKLPEAHRELAHRTELEDALLELRSQILSDRAEIHPELLAAFEQLFGGIQAK